MCQRIGANENKTVKHTYNSKIPLKKPYAAQLSNQHEPLPNFA
jgi:hypothetical protein